MVVRARTVVRGPFSVLPDAVVPDHVFDALVTGCGGPAGECQTFGYLASMVVQVACVEDAVGVGVVVGHAGRVRGVTDTTIRNFGALRVHAVQLPEIARASR